MINLKKNDAIAETIKQIMEKELSAKQKRIAALAGDKNAIDALDLAALRAGKKPVKEEETVEENAFDYKSPRQPEPNGGSGVKKGTRYGGSKQKEKPEQEEPKEKKEETSYFKERLIERAMLKMAAKKAFKALTGGSDEDQRKDLQRKMGVPQTGQKPTQKEEVEQIDELSKSTLASYAKKATRDARLKHGMGKDFEGISKSLRKPEYKAGAKEWEDKYKSDARKREAGVNKAIDRLAKEEVEQVEEREMTDAEMKKREEIVKSMKKGMSGFKERYGKRAKDVMYATATKQAMK